MSHRILDQVRAAWGDVFGTVPAGPDEDFFVCGGNSILAIRLQQALLVRTGTAVSVAELLRHRTIGAQAAHIGSASKSESGQDRVPGREC
ncbi:acyl carrier protein [Kitasatospora sp. NBC_01266]|uniref:acyl carrier protein n=1 Tax=Kitasatospora sp. NBC_01266 TaxID=2903572 RepID=UPI002E328D08|nr:acyl carrier protein [Kitasatospora sp. NBC_01266]